MERIRIDYSLNGGSTWSVISGNVDAASRSYSWTLPEAESFQCKIRLTDVSDETHTDTSNGNFTISPPFIRLTSPNGGERWPSMSTRSITWSALGVERVKLEYSIDGGNSWQPINTVDATPGSYSWTGSALESEFCLVRVTDAAQAKYTDVSDALFTIMKTHIAVMTPNGGEDWPAGSLRKITWQSEGVNSVRIEYTLDSGINWNLISESIDASTGSYSWRTQMTLSKWCIIRVSDRDNKDVWDVSDGVFTISKYLSTPEEIPQIFTVFSNSPNPFNPSTTISFTLPRAKRVTVDIFNLSGQKVGSVFTGSLEPGKHSVFWKAENLSAGMYFACIRAGAEIKTIKMLLMK